MPVAVVHSDRDEEKWTKAKQLAAEQGHADEYDYIMGIYKKMKGGKLGKSIFIRLGSKIYLAKSKYFQRKFYARVPIGHSHQGSVNYRYFYTPEEYAAYTRHKLHIKVQKPPKFDKSILCLFMGKLCMIKASQMGMFGSGDIMQLPLLPSKKNPAVKRHQNPNKEAEEAQQKAKAKPQANIFGGTDKGTPEKRKTDEVKNQKQRELQWLMEKIKSGKLPKGAAKLVSPKKTSPKKQAENQEKWETGLFSEGKKQVGLFEGKKQEPEKQKAKNMQELGYKEGEVKFVDAVNKILKDQIPAEEYRKKMSEVKEKKQQPSAPPDGKGEGKPPAAPESGKGKEAKEAEPQKEGKHTIEYESDVKRHMRDREKKDVFRLLKEKIEIEGDFEEYPKLKSDQDALAQYEAIQELLKKPINVQQTAYAKRDGAWLEEYNENNILINREKIGTPGKAQETVDSINHKISEQKRKGKISVIAQSIDTDDLIRQLRLMKNKVSHRENVEIVLDELKRRDIKNYDLIHKEFAFNKV